MDGTQKLPQRITAPALDALTTGKSYRAFVLALAAWLAYLTRRRADGRPVPFDDPKATKLQTRLEKAETSEEIICAVASVCPDALPEALTDGAFGKALRDLLIVIQSEGMSTLITREAADAA